MATRSGNRQSDHDRAVQAAEQIYRQNGKYAWINPDGERNKSWCNRYIDVVAAEKPDANTAWVIEIETEDSVSESEAKSQWEDYDLAYTGHWFLAIPVASKDRASTLLQNHGIVHCSVITWKSNQDGTHTFWGLPGIL